MTAYTFQQLIDFTRTSSGTFVGSNGLIQTTPQSRNLLTWTQEFDNAGWTKAQTTATANTTVAPDGTSTADTLTATAGAATHNASQVSAVSSGTVTFTVYAKAGTHSFIQMFHTSTNAATFNISTGTIGTVGAGVSAAITAVGNGWYRCSYTVTLVAAASVRIAMVTSLSAAYNESWTATGTETVFLWGAQLEQASTATDYTRNVGGLFPPRFDYDPVTLAPRGILIEEQRVNLLTYSAQFDNSDWSKSRITLTANSTVAPDGALAGDTLTATTGASDNALQTKTLTAVVHTFSIYLRATDTATTVNLGFLSGGFLASSVQVLSGPGAAVGSGLVGVSGLSTTQWTRVSVTTTSAVPAGPVSVIIYPGGGGTAGAAIVVWGAQLEAGAFATSYIPTVASQVTRTADQASIVAPMFAPWYNQSEGTFVADVTFSGDILTSYAFAVRNDALTNTVGFDVDSSGAYRLRITDNNVNQALVNGVSPVSANTTYLMAGAYRLDDFAVSANGGAVATDTAGTVPIGNTFMTIGSATAAGALSLNGHIRSIKYYPVRLSDTQLQALTA